MYSYPKIKEGTKTTDIHLCPVPVTQSVEVPLSKWHIRHVTRDRSRSEYLMLPRETSMFE